MRRGPLLLTLVVAGVCAVAVVLVLFVVGDEGSDDHAPVHAALPDGLELSLRLDVATLREAPALDGLARSSRSVTRGPFVVLRELLAERDEHGDLLDRLDGEVAVGRLGDDWVAAVRAGPALQASEWAGLVDAPHTAVRRGVLVASSDSGLLTAAIAALATATEPTADLPGAGELHVEWHLPPGAPLLRGLAESGVCDVLAESVPLAGPCRLRAVVELGAVGEVAAEFELANADAVIDLGPHGGVGATGGSIPTEPDATFLVAEAWTRPRSVLDALLGWQPPARQRLFHERLVEHGTTWDALADELAAPLAPGAVFALTRLVEADELELDTWDEGLVQPIPGTVVRLHWASPGARERFESVLDEHVEALLGDDVIDEAAHGARLVSTPHSPFDLSWSLLHPALLVDDRGVLLASHRRQLERALDSGGGVALAPADSMDEWRLVLLGPSLARFVEDLRWEHAEVATNRDWGRVRREIRAELDAEGALDPVERAAEEDRRVTERIDHRNQVEFPAAVEDWRERHAWLRRIGRVEASGRIESGSGAALRGRVRVEFR